MRRHLAAALLVLTLAGCGAGKATENKISNLESKNEELNQRLTKLENDLTDTKKELIQHQQAMQTMAERLKAMEVNVDKLAYSSTAH